MTAGQTLNELTSRILLGMPEIFDAVKPDWVLVHGDTATTAAVSMAAYYQRINVGHVEAGLRTRNIYSPWPEEINRRIAGVIAAKHFSPTEGSQTNLLNEHVPAETIHVTGNTVIDALLGLIEKIETSPELQADLDATLPTLDPTKKLIVVTGHRRENFGGGFENICHALKALAERGDTQIIYPVHLNPNVKDPVNRILSGVEGVELIPPIQAAFKKKRRLWVFLSLSCATPQNAPKPSTQAQSNLSVRIKIKSFRKRRRYSMIKRPTTQWRASRILMETGKPSLGLFKRSWMIGKPEYLVS